MRHLALALALLLAVATAAPAAASERVLYAGQAEAVVAHGGYVSWVTGSDRRRVVWRNGSLVDGLRLPYTTSLGSDRARRPVAIFTRCTGGYAKGCTVRELVLRRGRSRAIYTQRKGEGRPDGAMYRGTFALIAGGTLTARTGRPPGLFVRSAGSRRFRRVVKDVGNARSLTVGSRHAAFRTYRDDRDRMFGIDLKSGRARVFVDNDTFDEDCRCTTSSSRADWPAVAGRHLYWLETTFPQHMVGDPSLMSTRVGRARLDVADPEIEYFTPERLAMSFAVRGTRIVYTTGLNSEPYEVREAVDPAWVPSGTRIPART